jgi:hypothetical protein
VLHWSSANFGLKHVVHRRGAGRENVGLLPGRYVLDDLKPSDVARADLVGGDVGIDVIHHVEAVRAREERDPGLLAGLDERRRPAQVDGGVPVDLEH